MSAKYLNINIGATAAAVVPTLVRIDDVQRITMPTPVGAAAATLTLFYKGGGSSALLTQVQGVGAGSPTAAQIPGIIKGFWDAIVASIAQPWNLPVYPSPSGVWDQTFLPASQVPVVPAGQGAANPTLGAKVGQPMRATNGGGAVADVVFVSIA